jgi:hypothetical protein
MIRIRTDLDPQYWWLLSTLPCGWLCVPMPVHRKHSTSKYHVSGLLYVCSVYKAQVTNYCIPSSFLLYVQRTGEGGGEMGVHFYSFVFVSWKQNFNLDPDSDPKCITDPDPNLQIVSDPDPQHWSVRFCITTKFALSKKGINNFCVSKQGWALVLEIKIIKANTSNLLVFSFLCVLNFDTMF